MFWTCFAGSANLRVEVTMKFDAKLRPEDIASTDETRRHLVNAWFDKATSKLVATNGHMLITVPCEAEAGDVTGPVPTDALKSARRRKDFKTGKGRIRLGKKLADDGKALHRREQNVTYPQYKDVFPKFKKGDKGTVTFGVNPHCLVALMKAAGGDGTYSPLIEITLNVTPTMLDPIRVVAAYGNHLAEMLVMPGRV